MRILLAVVSGCATGIFFRSLFILEWPAAVFVLILAAICVGAAFLTSRTAYALIALTLVSATLGGARVALYETPPPAAFAADVRQRVTYEGVVVASPDLRDANQRVAVRVSKGAESALVLAVVPRTTIPSVGDRVRISGMLSLPEPFASEGGRVFRYDKYLEVRGIRFLLQYGSLTIRSEAPWYSVLGALARVKRAFESGLARALPEPYAALAGGIVIGGKSGLGSELQDDFVRSGLVQVIVLSGYNVMVVAEWTIVVVLALAALLARLSPGLRIERRLAIGAAAVTLLVFVGIAGFSATALRAACMALIALYARATGRSYAASRALLLVVLLMLVWNPYYLAFDPGFGLSVAATAGLIWLAPLIENWLAQWVLRVRRVCQGERCEELSEQAVPTATFWSNAAATTLAAQIAVLPLLLYETGNLSFVSIIANLLVMPVVPLAMGFAALAGVGGMLFASLPALAFLVGLPAYIATAYVITVARVSAALPGAALVLPAFPFVLVLAAYAGLAALAASKRASITPQFILAKNAST